MTFHPGQLIFLSLARVGQWPQILNGKNIVSIQDSLNDLNVYKASPEEIVQRKLSHRSNNLKLVKQDKLRKRIAKGTPYFIVSFIEIKRQYTIKRERLGTLSPRCGCVCTYLFIKCLMIAYSLNVFVTLFPAKNKEKEAKDVKKSAVAVLREVLYDQSQVRQK